MVSGSTLPAVQLPKFQKVPMPMALYIGYSLGEPPKLYSSLSQPFSVATHPYYNIIGVNVPIVTGIVFSEELYYLVVAKINGLTCYHSDIYSFTFSKICVVVQSALLVPVLDHHVIHSLASTTL